MNTNFAVIRAIFGNKPFSAISYPYQRADLTMFRECQVGALKGHGTLTHIPPWLHDAESAATLD
jgi:hypothetical protein